MSEQNFELEKFRLSKTHVVPIEYIILLNPNLETEQFCGRVTILIEILQVTSEIKLHSSNLNIHEVKINGADQLFSFEPEYDFMIIKSPEGKPYEVGFSTIYIDYNAKFSNKNFGFYLSTYKTMNGSIRKLAVSKLEPTYARKVFPCFDQPDMKAEFLIFLTCPKEPSSYKALSNMDFAGKKEFDDKNDLIRFSKSVQMSTYLVGFIVCDFDFIEGEVRFENYPNFKLRVYSAPEQKEKITFARNVAMNIIKFYVDYFNIKYPLPKLDLVAIPDFISGAMEQWGIITFRETALLIDENIASHKNMKRVAEVIGHELAHMWFGNLVTLSWWNDLWLNEGFASYIEIKGVNNCFPNWQMDNHFIIEVLHDVMNLDSKLSSHAIVKNVVTPDQITEIFDQISYEKGASIIRMLEHTIGERRFQVGIQNYLNTFQFSNAKTSDLWSILQSSCNIDCDILQFMDTWTNQKGYPIVNVKRDDNGHLILTQKRFFSNPEYKKFADGDNLQKIDEQSNLNYKWIIPISLITNTNILTEISFLSNVVDSLKIELPEDTTWFKINHNQIGFYRVNYEIADWKMLMMNWNQFNTADKVNLLNDAFANAMGGYLTYSIPLEMGFLLKGTTDYFVLYAAKSALEYLLKIFHDDVDIKPELNKYVGSIIKETYDYIKQGNNLSFLNKQIKAVVYELACLAQYKKCLDECCVLFNKWIADEAFKIPRDIESIVISYGMKLVGTSENWNIVWNRYLKSTDAQEKIRLLTSLSNIHDEDIINKFLTIALEGYLIRSQDFFIVVRLVANNVFFGTNIAWNFVKNNWCKIVNKFTLNDRTMGSVFPCITKYFSTGEHLIEMKKFCEVYPEAGAGENMRKLAIENIISNLDWVKYHRNDIKTFFQK